MRRAVPWVTGVLAVALLVAGAVTFAATEPATPGDVGWSADEPLPPGRPVPYTSTLVLSFDDSTVMWSDGGLVGAGLVVGGLLLLAALAGWAVGRRARGAARSG
jgi:hypothetical protein